jgi:GT2 family glycosyltransferase
MDVAIIYTNWRRKNNLHKIIKNVFKQTLLPKIIIIDNSSQDEQNKFIIDDDKVTIINSDNSLKCWQRWLVAIKEDSKYVCVMDDDICFSIDNVLENCYDFMENNLNIDCIGYEGVDLIKGKSYFDNNHYGSQRNKNIKVDIVKGRFMFIRKSSIVNLNLNPDLTCDDIKVSSHLKNKLIPNFLYNGFYELPQGSESLSRRHYQPDQRNYAAKKYFK